jgi:hypothetical protein
MGLGLVFIVSGLLFPLGYINQYSWITGRRVPYEEMASFGVVLAVIGLIMLGVSMVVKDE